MRYLFSYKHLLEPLTSMLAQELPVRLDCT